MHHAAWLLALAPLGLVGAAFGGMRAARIAAAGAFGVVVVAVATALAGGRFATGTLGVHGVGLGFAADALTLVMGGLVSFIGLVVVCYSRAYLDGDPGQARFFRWLCLTLAAVLTLVLSGNLAQFAAGWIATSLCLHRLLVFYPEREAGRRAAWRKFVLSRVADVCVISACVLIHRAFGTLDIAAVSAAAPGASVAGADAIALLLVGAALLKSAQFPFHIWLPRVIETPTPVSALLHAGIINAGGFLIVRLAAVMSLSPAALDVLAVAGGFTALFASLVMPTQTSVKMSLAWSTIAQMGFMLLQCGLGAFSAAVLHIVAHGLYKAHAFLGSGSIVQGAVRRVPAGRPHPARMTLALVLAVAVLAGGAAVIGVSFARSPAVVALGAIFVMGVAHLIATSVEARPSAAVIGRGVLAAVVVSAAWVLLQGGAEALFAGTLPANAPLRSVFDLGLVVLVVVSFGAVVVLQDLLPHRATRPLWRAAYVHLLNGLYVEALADRLMARRVRA